MNTLVFPWLQLGIVLPLAGAALLRTVSRADVARKWSVVITALTFIVTVGAWRDFTRLDATAAHDRWDVLAAATGRAWLTIDNFSAPLLPLTALLFTLTAVATLRTKIRRFPFAGTLASLSLVLATLSVSEPWLVIALLALGTIPPYFELRARHKPTRVYLLHMALFIAALVLGQWLVDATGGTLSPAWSVAPLVVAVLVRSGIAPLHCWMTDLFEHASFGTALLFVTPMMGAYAAVRLILPIASEGVLHTLGNLALLTALYAAGMALVQREARRFFCYIFLSHSALVLVGLDTLSPIGLTGALCVWLSIGLGMAGFGLTLRALEARHGRLSLVGYRGIYDHTPMLAVCFLLTGMASIGFPGTFGFLGTELLVDGVVHAYPYIGIAVVIAAALNGVAIVKAYFLIFTGTRHDSSVPLQIGPRERFAVLLLAGLILGGGLFPQPGVASRHDAAMKLLSDRQPLVARQPSDR